jgi:hypothetical protein
MLSKPTPRSHFIRAARKGIVLDTNVFVLFVVGHYDRECVPKIKRSRGFDIDDVARLASLLALTRNLLVTTAILAETCNLLDRDNRDHDQRIFAALRALLRNAKEHHTAATQLADHPLFLRFGFADCSVADLADSGHLVVTDDLPLAAALEDKRLPVVNFNNLRSANWLG